MTPNPNLRKGKFSSEKGASRPGGASASAGASGGSKAPRLSGTSNPFARAAEMRVSAGLASTARISSGPTSDESATTGVRGMVQSWPLASQHAESRLTAPRPVWQAPSGRQPEFIPKKGGFRCCTAHSSVRRKSDNERTEWAKAFVSCEVLSFVGVSVFALTRLQNLVSGVWLKKRVSVAAEASRRGLVVGGSNR